jgi:hypothetical protein
MSTYNWTIANLERNTADDGVTIAHWRCTATDSIDGNDYTASSYGTMGFTPDPTDPEYIPFESLTEEIVLGWIFFSEEDFRKNVEKALNLNILEQSQPSTVSGMPWQSEGE